MNTTKKFFKVESRMTKAAFKRQLREQGITLIELINTYDWYDMEKMRKVYEYSIYEALIAAPVKVLSSKDIQRVLKRNKRNCQCRYISKHKS